MIYGSSVINLTNQGSSGSFTGPSGPIGTTGATGATGASITGPIGPTGYGITGATYNSSSAGVTFYVSGISPINLNLRGPSGANGTGFLVLHGITHTFNNNSKSILVSDDLYESQKNEIIIDQDETIYFKSIDFKSINGEIEQITDSSTNINVKGKTYDIRPMGNTGEILFISEAGEARGARGTSWDARTKQLFFTIDATRQPIYDNDNIATTNIINTFDVWPSTASNIDLLGSATLFTQNFSGLTQGRSLNQLIIDPPFITDGLGNYTIDPTANFAYTSNPDIVFHYKTFLGQSGGENLFFYSDRSFHARSTSPSQPTFTPQNLSDDYIGSCCICGITDPTDKKCFDYVGRDYCIAQGGQYSTRSCQERDGAGDCFIEGACCSNNKCNNTTVDSCVKVGGVFYPNELCGKTILAGKDPFNCPTSCPSTKQWACCVKGKCYNLSEAECSSIPDSAFLLNITCANLQDTICCDLPNYSGACCNGRECTNGTNPQACKDAGGVFMGLGSSCEEINCCGVSYTPDYYSDNITCRITLNDACYEIGTKIGGGYLVGIVGMPSTCNTFHNAPLALGEPVECLCNPRGKVNGDLAEQWAFKNCKGYKNKPQTTDEYGNSFTAAQKYFARTHPKIPSEASYANKCLFKGGAPYIHQLYNATASGVGVTWPHAAFFEGTDSYDGFAGPWAFDNQTCNVMSEVTGLGTPSSELYRYLSEKFYGQRAVHIMWALIMAPEDIKFERDAVEIKQVNWSGMFESRINGNGTTIPYSYFIEPLSTCIVDGLLSTRMHDIYSTTKPELWFRDYDGDGKDKNAYVRFKGDLSNLWPESAVKSEIESDINEFKYQYKRMWEDRNIESTAVRQISNWNQNNKYGYDDWYIPSITELHYIAGNFNTLNTQILLNGDITHEPLETKEYWSSTSVCRITDWNNNNHTNKSFWTIETLGGVATSTNYSSLTRLPISQDSKFNLGHQICGGQGMLVQDFKDITKPETGMKKKTATAIVRPVRRIPIVVGISNLNTEVEYQNYDFINCPSCVGFDQQNSGSDQSGGNTSTTTFNGSTISENG
jgi:hypothetical protein